MRIEKKLYNHAFDVAFSVETDESDPFKVTNRELIVGLLMRFVNLVEVEELREACGHVDTYKNEEEPNNG